MTNQAPIVWKVQKRVYYTRSLQSPNRFGNVESACSRMETSWNAVINGRIVTGFDRRRDALTAVAREKEVVR